MTDLKARSNHIKHQLLTKHQMTLKAFAEKYNFNYETVSGVCRGINGGGYGKGKEVTDKLIELIGPLTPPNSDQQAA